MKCLQCGKPATSAGIVSGYEIRECDDKHRTAQLTAQQEKEIVTRLLLNLDGVVQDVFNLQNVANGGE